MKRRPTRLIQLARSVNDNVVGEHIGQLCRDLADALEEHRDALKGAAVIANHAHHLISGAKRPAVIVAVDDDTPEPAGSFRHATDSAVYMKNTIWQISPAVWPHAADAAPMDDRALILAAMKYRDGNDSCNSFYMGSMATARLYHALGMRYGDDGFAANLAIADDATVAKVKAAAQPYIDYMLAHPVRRCPSCDQIVGTK